MIEQSGQEKSVERRSRTKWTPIEDRVLISAWLNTSKDPIVSNEQRAGAFWKRIAAYVAASPQLAGMKKREPDHYKQMWAKINEGVCNFVGSYEAASKQRSSGQNENDVVILAHTIFFSDYNVKFGLEHAWRELRHDQKWCASKENGREKRRKIDEESSTSVQGSFGDDAEVTRPAGVKAAKAKAKKVVSKPHTVEDEGSAVSQFQSMWAIKEKDLDRREKLSKHKMLENLLGKTELNELEIALKDKLISDMLSNV